MPGPNAEKRRRQLALALLTAGMASGGLAWQFSAHSLATANEFAGRWITGEAGGPIGEIYSHSPEEFPFPQLGDVPQDNETPASHIDPRSLGDTRVRQFDELDRPRFNERQTHRGAQVNEERFSVAAMTGEDDARLAAAEFGRAWDEFAKLADVFTDAHRNPDFGIGQLLIVIDNEPVRERDQPQRTLQLQNGQTIVYINAAEGEPPLSEQLGTLRQGAVHALLHLAELDRKFPLWAQQGLAEYTAEKIAQRDAAEEARDLANDEEGLEPNNYLADDVAVEEFLPERYLDDDAALSPSDQEQAGSPTPPVDVEYWRMQRSEQDRLAESPGEEATNASAALERVRFLLEGDDAAHAPDFLLALRVLAEDATDPWLASRGQLAHTQLLPPATETVVDDLFESLQQDYLAWRVDPSRGQPLFVPAANIPDPTMLQREKAMEVVLKLAWRQKQMATVSEIQPRITEFGAEGQQDVSAALGNATAVNVEQLYHDLIDTDVPWATIDADGQLLLWTDHEQLAESLGINDDRFTSEYREGRWVLVTTWDEETQLEAWLEHNNENPTRPLVKFAARQRASEPRVVELDARAKLR